MGRIGLGWEKFDPTKFNRIEKNSTCCQSFIIYKSFEIEVNERVRMDYISLDFNIDVILILSITNQYIIKFI